MTRKTYLLLPIFLFLAGCQNKPDVFVENTLFKNSNNSEIKNNNPFIEKKATPPL